MQLTINIPFRPAYVSDHGIQPPVPQTVVTIDAAPGTSTSWAIERMMASCTSAPAPWPVHCQTFRPHTVSDQHGRIQRIVGIPLSFVERAPRAKRLTWRESHEPFDQLDFADVAWEDTQDDRTPLDLPVPEGTTLDDHAMPLRGYDSHGLPADDYNGFDSRDTQAPKLPVGRHSRPVAHDPADLERMADQILAADDADLLRPTIATQKMDLPRDDRKPWPVNQRTSPSDWEYRRYTYTLGHKPCPRCHGNPRPFAQKPCRYCSQQGGWAITRTRMTPFHPEHGFQLTPPRLDGKPVHTKHWRTRGEYYGDVRIRRGVAPSESIMQEIRRRHFANVTRRQLSALATKEVRQLIAA